MTPAQKSIEDHLNKAIEIAKSDNDTKPVAAILCTVLASMLASEPLLIGLMNHTHQFTEQILLPTLQSSERPTENKYVLLKSIQKYCSFPLHINEDNHTLITINGKECYAADHNGYRIHFNRILTTDELSELIRGIDDNNFYMHYEQTSLPVIPAILFYEDHSVIILPNRVRNYFE